MRPDTSPSFRAAPKAGRGHCSNLTGKQQHQQAACQQSYRSSHSLDLGQAMGIRGISGFLDPRDLSPAFDPVLRLAARMNLEFNDEWA
jgi:hypothetical protein